MSSPARNQPPERTKGSMRRRLFRSTAVGAGIGAATFLALGLYLNAANGAPILSNPGPVSFLAVVGGTIGGLVGPLFGRRAPPGSGE